MSCGFIPFFCHAERSEASCYVTCRDSSLSLRMTECRKTYHPAHWGGCVKTKVSETLLLLEGGVPEGGGGR